MSGFDSIDQLVKEKLVAKKYDRASRLPPVEDKDRWDRLMEKCGLEDYEVNEILNAIKPFSQHGKYVTSEPAVSKRQLRR
jgi:hypothetical protein